MLGAGLLAQVGALSIASPLVFTRLRSPPMAGSAVVFTGQLWLPLF
jgi:hypothetical protein